MEIDKIQETINESSNNVEINTCNILANTEWNEIIENSYYTDPVEKKFREVDLLAINNQFLGFEDTEKNRIIFLIECKYIKDKIVLWFKNKNIDKAKTFIHRNYVFSSLNLDQYIHGTTADGKPLIHHYLENNKVAKKWDYVRWDYEVEKKIKEPQDIIGNSINQLTNALYFFSRQSEFYKNKSSIFPILVVNNYNNIFQVKENGGYVNINSHFQFEIEYSIKINDHGTEDFYQLIDVVSVDELKNFINYFSNNTLEIIKKRLIIDYSRRNTPHQSVKINNPGR